jgi:hypothetical protein
MRIFCKHLDEHFRDDVVGFTVLATLTMRPYTYPGSAILVPLSIGVFFVYVRTSMVRTIATFC